MQTGTAPAAGLPEAGGQALDEAPKRHLAGCGAAEQSGRYPAVEDASAAPASYLGRLRLLVALDCLLVEGSVGKAAARMGLSAAAMSRMLAQARGMFGDKLLVRSARGLIPTPRAEMLRGRLRALAARGEAQAAMPAAPLADLDWPAYLSPRSLRTPWFLQAACLVAMAGHRVVLHGSYGDDASGKLELACEALRIPVCLSLSEAEASLQHRRIAFLPLPAFSPKMAGLLSLYALFEARSAVNGAVHLLNPLNAPAALLGVAQPAYSELHRDTAMLLGHGELSVIGSSRDVAEWIPHRSVTIHRLVGGEPGDMRLKPFGAPRPQPRLPLSSHEYWRAVWNGAADDDRAVQIVEATAALALMTIAKAGPDRFGYWHEKAGQLWKNRIQWH
ncbi:LysR family transcriptional regulator [Aquamicrobium terrae]